MANNPPAYQFYARDFDAATSDWSNEEVGAYIRLLNHQWENNGLPADTERIARILRVTKDQLATLWKVLKVKFPPGSNGILQNPRMEQVRYEQSEFREKKRLAGVAGARVRWGQGQQEQHKTDESANGTANADANGKRHGKRHGKTMALQSPVSSLLTPTPNSKDKEKNLRKKRKEPAENEETAKRILDVYKEKANPSDGGRQQGKKYLLRHLGNGIAEEGLTRAAVNYGLHCDAKGQTLRKDSGNFFSEKNGLWEQYADLDWKPPQPTPVQRKLDQDEAQVMNIWNTERRKGKTTKELDKLFGGGEMGYWLVGAYVQMRNEGYFGLKEEKNDGCND